MNAFGGEQQGSSFDELRRRAVDAMSRNDLSALSAVITDLRSITSPESEALVMFAEGTAAAIRGEMPAALEKFTVSRELFRNLSDAGNVAHATVNMGMAQLHLGNMTDAYALLREAVGLAEVLGDRALTARANNGIASVFRLTGDYPKAAEVYHRALDIFEELGNQHAVGMIHGNLGGVYRPMGEPERALASYERALEIFEETNTYFAITQTLGAIGQTLTDLQRSDETEQYYRRAIEMAHAHEFTAETERWSIYLATHLLEADRSEEARSIMKAFNVDEVADPHVVALYHHVSGDLYSLDADRTSARHAYEQALAVATAISSPHLASDAHDALRDLARERGDIAAYAEHSEEYHRLQESLRGKGAAVKLAMLEKQREIDELERVHQRHLDILYSTLPKHVADRVAGGHDVHDVFDEAAVMFTDIVGFTTRSGELDPGMITRLLASIFEYFDDVCDRYGVTKIKTIGDSYMAVALPSADRPDLSCAVRLAMAGREMSARTFTWPDDESSEPSPVRFRMGMHIGPLTAGVIGTRRMQYDVWGDTVNVASRMESHGEPGRIHVSEAFAEALQGEKAKWRKGEMAKRRKGKTANGRNGEKEFEVILRGTIDIKGKGAMTTYWLEGL